MNLIAALNVVTGVVFGQIYAQKSFAEFSTFLRALLDGAVKRGAHCVHLILDNGSLHRPKFLETWLAATYPNLTVVHSLAAGAVLMAQPDRDLLRHPPKKGTDPQ